MIKQRDKFSMTEYNYALNLNSFRFVKRMYHDYGVVDAIWFSKRKGLLTVHKGTLFHYDSEIQTVDDYIRCYNGRNTGYTDFKWDGTDIWSSSSNFLKMVEAHAELDPILRSFPKIPEGYTGWYSIK